MEIKESIAELRQMLQAPRRPVDTWYGRHVMRTGSIFLTRIAIERGLTPNQITLASLIAGILSAVFFLSGAWLLGILFLNLWYLLDHVDGEVARYTKASSNSGFFFDTVINFIVEPLIFLGIGCGLSGWMADRWLGLAVLAAFGSLFLGLIPMCEDAVILISSRKAGKLPRVESQAQAAPSQPPSLTRRLFSFWHLSITFPSAILSLTVFYAVSFLIGLPRVYVMQIFLIYYAVSVTVIWIAQLFQQIHSRKLDKVIF